MYPLNTTTPYPRNQWYIAGYKSEFGPKVFARPIMNEPIIFYRTEDGKPVALSGRCVHRFMPLDNAELDGNSVVCPYHGYTFGSDGRCHKIPTGGEPSSHARLRCYPVVERGPFVWIWMGEPDSADISLLPNPVDIGLGDDQHDWKVDVGETYIMNARASLLVDNLFDLSHLAFIHSVSAPGGDKLVLIPPVMEEAEGRLRVSRYVSDIVIEEGSLFAKMLPVAQNAGALLAHLHTEMYSPGLINASGPWLFRPGKGSAHGEMVASLNFVHGITPMSDTATYYFGVVTRNYHLEDEQLSSFLADQTDRVRAEDVTALEAVESALDETCTTRREISTKADEGAIKARSILRKLMKSPDLQESAE